MLNIMKCTDRKCADWIFIRVCNLLGTTQIKTERFQQLRSLSCHFPVNTVLIPPRNHYSDFYHQRLAFSILELKKRGGWGDTDNPIYSFVSGFFLSTVWLWDSFMLSCVEVICSHFCYILFYHEYNAFYFIYF